MDAEVQARMLAEQEQETSAVLRQAAHAHVEQGPERQEEHPAAIKVGQASCCISLSSTLTTEMATYCTLF